MPTRFLKRILPAIAITLGAVFTSVGLPTQAQALEGSVTFSGGTCQESNLRQCIKYVVCPGGFSMRGNATTMYCSSTYSPSQVRPTCSRHRTRNDWTWNASMKRCERRRATGRIIAATENIVCPGGTSYLDGACFSPSYARPGLSSSPGGSTRLFGSNSPSNSAVTPRCPNGFTLRLVENNGRLCSRNIQADQRRPSCRKFGGFPYEWNGTYCVRYRHIGRPIERAGLEYCESGYSMRRGVCVRQARTEYAKPSI